MRILARRRSHFVPVDVGAAGRPGRAADVAYMPGRARCRSAGEVHRRGARDFGPMTSTARLGRRLRRHSLRRPRPRPVGLRLLGSGPADHRRARRRHAAVVRDRLRRRGRQRRRRPLRRGRPRFGRLGVGRRPAARPSTSSRCSRVLRARNGWSLSAAARRRARRPRLADPHRGRHRRPAGPPRRPQPGPADRRLLAPPGAGRCRLTDRRAPQLRVAARPRPFSSAADRR